MKVTVTWLNFFVIFLKM